MSLLPRQTVREVAHAIKHPRETWDFLRTTLSLFRIFFLTGLFSLLLGGGVIFLWLITLDIPSVDGFHTRRVPESTKIYDRTGKILLYDVHGTIRRTRVSLENISRNTRNASIAIEDTEFYHHMGIKPTAILRALFTNIQDRRFSQGGSTITQQVVKNTLLSSEKTITRKIKEWILSLKIEQILTKDQILEIYLNETPYGGTVYGVEEASKFFFGKTAFEVSLAESAYIAALPQAPTYYSPLGNHRDELEKRKDLVLSRMYETGFITADEYEGAKKEVVEFVAHDDNSIKAPHFVFYVREYLEEKYGVEMVNEGGLSVITTLDNDLQQRAEEVVSRHALENEKKFNAENAAVVAIDPHTGQILALVGSRGYFDDAIDGKFNVALAKRQPGSAFKPFVYAAAFEKGYTPETVVWDVKTQFSLNCPEDVLETNTDCYAPENYDGVFRGPTTLRDALAQSINIPAVKTMYLVGVGPSLEAAQRMGITTLTERSSYYGLPLVLGGGEVTLLEMVSAYGVFANEGKMSPKTPIIKIENKEGDVLEEFIDPVPTDILPTNTALTVSDILSDNEARTRAFGSNSSLYFPGFDVAVKTGTTNDYRDAWIIGYTPDLVLGAWAGNNDNTPMEKKVAGFIIAPLWNEIMRFSLERASQKNFPPPENEDTSLLPPVLRGDWTSVGPHSILYSINKENPRLLAVNPQVDQQFSRWEFGVRNWILGSPLSGAFLGSTTPTTTPAIQYRTTPPTKLISFPVANMVIERGTPTTFKIENSFGDQMRKVSFFLGGVYLGASEGEPFSLSVVPTTSGPTTLRVVAEGLFGVISETVSFSIQ
ncbi:MAG: PBP1A family penicillin-binding protein [Patescibacteria group bacterium]